MYRRICRKCHEVFWLSYNPVRYFLCEKCIKFQKLLEAREELAQWHEQEKHYYATMNPFTGRGELLVDL